MLRFILSLVIFVPFPPLFAVMREGPSDNGRGVGPVQFSFEALS